MKGILFTEDMFRAVIDGSKNQTRRLVISEKPRYVEGEKVFMKEPYLIMDNEVYYKFDYALSNSEAGWKNKLFMPEKYARYFIEITYVVKERLQDITEDDAIAEGIKIYSLYYEQKNIYKDYTNSKKTLDNPIDSYRTLWEKINGKLSWKTNPDVWVYEFKLLK